MVRFGQTAVSYIHAGVVTSLVLAGILLAEDPLLWLRAFGELFAGIAGGLLVAAGGFETLYAMIGTKLQPHKTGPKQRVSEALETVRAAWVFSALAAWTRYQLLRGRPTALVWTLADAQPEAPNSLALYCFKLFLVTLLVDGYMYAKHRFLHSQPWFAFHSQHHTYHDPSPFASFAVAPVEAFLTFAPVLLTSLPAAPIWAHAYLLWVAGFVALNLYLHAGYRVELLETALRAVGLNSSAFHNVHHERTVVNFGELCYIWDRILGTGAHPPALPAAAADAAPGAKGKSS